MRAIRVREAEEESRRSLGEPSGTGSAVWRRVALPHDATVQQVHALVLGKLRGWEADAWEVRRAVQTPGSVLIEDDDDVRGLAAGDALEVTLGRKESKKAQ